jgi:hypothetical protein
MVIGQAGHGPRTRLWSDGEWLQPGTNGDLRGRFGAAIGAHVAAGQVVLFGGEPVPVPTNDTWVFDGTRWVEAQPAHRPPRRTGARMAWCSATGSLLLFGGRDERQSLGDVWAWDGADWRPIPVVGRPPAPRHLHSMSEDPVRDELVVFGGLTELEVGDDGSERKTVRLDDTWVLLPPAAARSSSPTRCRSQIHRDQRSTSGWRSRSACQCAARTSSPPCAGTPATSSFSRQATCASKTTWSPPRAAW